MPRPSRSTSAPWPSGKRSWGPDHPDVTITLNNLAVLYYHQEKYKKAAEVLDRIIKIDEKALGPDHPTLASDMSNYAMILTKLGRDVEAAEWSAKAEAIQKRREDGK